ERDVEGGAGAGGDAGAAVVGEHVVRRVGGINPDVVAVDAAGRAVGLGAGAAVAGEGLAAVVGGMQAAGSDHQAIGVGGIDAEANVVAGAADEGAVPTDDGEVLAAVVAAPQRALIEGLD